MRVLMITVILKNQIFDTFALTFIWIQVWTDSILMVKGQMSLALSPLEWSAIGQELLKWISLNVAQICTWTQIWTYEILVVRG